jgi:hypothetical protein
MKKKTRRINRGDKYICGVCGLVVRVSKTCGCIDMCDLLCCGEQMTKKKKIEKINRKKRKPK